MLRTPMNQRYGQFFMYSATVALSGAPVIEKYIGGRWVYPYFLVAGIILWLGGALEPWFRSRPELTRWLAVAALACISTAVLIVYPIANVQVPGHGSDNDDALDITTRALLAFQYPYHQKTYLGNPAIPMPGEMLLAVPFVLIGGSAYQILFWLPIAFLELARLGRSPSKALCLLVPTLVASPILLRGLATGSDHLSNSIVVFTAFSLAVRSLDLPAPTWKRVLAMAFFGVALSTRVNFSFLVVIFLGVAVKRAGWRAAVVHTMTAGVTAALITIPFYLASPAEFAPLHTATKVGVIAHGELLIPVVTLIFALVLAVRSPSSLESVLGGAFGVLATPIVIVATVSLALRGTWEMAGYMDLVLVFCLASYGLGWIDSPPVARRLLAESAAPRAG
jgi:hypothetical protein